MDLIKEIIEKANLIINIVLSDPKKSAEFSKIKVRQNEGNNESYFQLEKFKDNKAFHQNILISQLKPFLENGIQEYRQILINFEGKSVQAIFYGKKPKIKRTKNDLIKTHVAHDRKKNYLLFEGEDIPPLVDLGVFSKDNKVIKSKYDKFRQINRFIEIIDEGIKEEKSLTVADFGCGKSYLTFLLYYYLQQRRKIDATIVGYGLKKEVVEQCNQTAKKYGYEKLTFRCGDVSKESIEKNTDMMITLHACDTATDYALATAIKSGVKYLFSVPCCKHEINSTIKKGGDFDLLLKHGIIKERFSALLTDAIRAEIMEDFGYKTDLIEFVDFEHSPKNIMIRAQKTGVGAKKKGEELKNLCKKYGISQTLIDLVYQN